MLAPRDEVDLAEAVRAANAPLRIVGGGTRGEDGPGEVLSVAGLSGITLHEPGALTLVAGAGTPVAAVAAALEAEGQRLAFEPMDHRALLGTGGEPTIGGVVAANVSGPRRVQAGAARDFLLGVRFVDGTGAVVKNGGRVMKNVTGYDLTRLMAGSRGALGVLTEVAFKVLPRPAAVATLAVAVDGPDRAVAALASALGSPFDVTGAAWLPAQGALVRVEGFARSVAYRVGRLAERLAGFGAVTPVEGDPWPAIRDVQAFHGASGDVWRLSVRPSDAAGVVARLNARDLVLDWGGGLIWALLPDGTDARAALHGVGGHATLVRAEAATMARLGRMHPEPAAVAALSRGVKARFDPRGILNVGDRA